MRSLRSVSWLVLAALPHASAFGQTINWAGGDGPWNDAARWSPANVPDNTAETARLAGLGVYTVTLTGGFTIDAFEILNTSATLHITNNSSLAAHGVLLHNSGQLRVNNAAGINFTSISIPNQSAIEGPGQIWLDASSNLDTAYINVSPGGLLTNRSPHTIRGSGRLYGAYVNQSLIHADLPLRTLEIRGTITQSASGELRTNPGLLSLGNGAVVTGGAIAGAGSWQAVGTPTIDGVLINSVGRVVNNSTLRLGAGGLNNHYAIEVNDGTGVNFTSIQAQTAITLSGPGVINLHATASNLDTAYLDSVGGAIITQGPDHRVWGTGRIYAPMTNLGSIGATMPGRSLEIRSAISNLGEGRIVADGGDAILGNGAAITGGRLESTGDGLLRTLGAASISNVTNFANMRIDNNSTLNLGAGGMVNRGTLSINDGQGINLTRLRAAESAAVTGTGSIVLRATSNLDTAYIESANATVVLTNGSNHRISGRGRIYATIQNDGVLRADDPDGPLEIRSRVTQSPGGLIVGAGALVHLGSGAEVQGGLLGSVGNGAVRAVGSSSIQSVTNSGRVEVFNNASLSLRSGVVVNDSLIVVNPTQGNNITRLRVEDDVTLAGVGVTQLNAGANPDTAIIDSPGARVLTLAQGQVITGNGNVYAQINNNSTIAGDATDTSSILRLRSLVQQGSGGTLLARRGSVALQGARIVGGTFSSTLEAGAIVAIGGNSSISGVTSFAPLHVDNNSTLGIQGLVNNGLLLINPTSGNNFTQARFDGTQTLAGGGLVRLNASASLDSAYLSVNPADATLTIDPGQTVFGRGNLYGRYNLRGVLSPGAADEAIDTIGLRNGSVTFDPSATLRIRAEGRATGQFDQIVGNSALTLGGTLNIRLVNVNPAATCYEIPFISGPSISGQFASVVLDAPPPTLDRVWRIDYQPNQVLIRLTCRADFNGDCEVDNDDFVMFAGWYNIFDCTDPTMAQTCPGDLNRDGFVDLDDFSLFVLAYTDLLCP